MKTYYLKDMWIFLWSPFIRDYEGKWSTYPGWFPGWFFSIWNKPKANSRGFGIFEISFEWRIKKVKENE